MKINTSYELRGAKVTSHLSIPNPTVESLTEALKHVAWVSGRMCAEVEVVTEQDES